MKIAVIGGGSTYTPELVSGFISLAECLPLRELWLMDIDPTRLQVVGGFAQRMVAAHGAPFEVILSSDQRQTISGSDYVLTQFRVGKMPARIKDEYLGRRHGLIGQETTGVGGMAKALRTIPVVLQIVRDIQETAPQALLINFTNPSGLVTEAIARYAPRVSAVGVCNSGITTRMEISNRCQDLLGRSIDPDQVILLSLGLNHLTWHRGFLVDGQDVWPMLFKAYLAQQRSSPAPDWNPNLLDSLGMLPNDYLHYYYDTARKLQKQQEWPPSRGELVTRLERSLLEAYADPSSVVPPAELLLRGGAFYSTLATRLIHSHYNDLGEVETVNVRNRGTIKDFPPDWILEMPCTINRQGLHPLPADPLPEACRDLVSKVKEYELFTVEAAVHGDREAALHALQIHPLGPTAENAPAVLDDILAIHREYLPQFFEGNGIR